MLYSSFSKIYLITLLIFIPIDVVWIGLIAKNFYNKYIGFLMTSNVNWLSAIIFYLLFIVGLVIFVISPAIEKKMWLNALTMGLLFGLVTYATYDLTNLATLKNWPLIVTLVDLVWGMLLSGSVATISYFVAIKLGL